MTSEATKPKASRTGKQCTKCEVYQPKKNFGRSDQNAGGRRAWCNDCWREYQKLYHREYRKKRKAQPQGDELLKIINRVYREDFQVARRNRELFRARKQRKQECAEPGCITLIGYHQQTLCRRHEEQKTEEKIAKRLRVSQ